jgi:ATP-dependent Lon protease
MTELFPRPKIVPADHGETSVTPSGPQSRRRETLEQVTIPQEVAVLPLRNLVLFPSTIIPLPIGREKSRRLVDSVLPD